MLFANKQKIDDLIIDRVKGGPIGTLLLIKKIQDSRPRTTKEAIYASLRKLNNEEVVVIHKGVVSLSLGWVKKLEEFALDVGTHYSGGISLPGYFTSLKEGERIQYHFKNLNLLDNFANHIIITLLGLTPEGEHCYIYDVHNWVVYGRQESEDVLVNTLERESRLMLLAIGENTILNKSIAKSITEGRVQCYVLPNKLFNKDTYSFIVIGDFVIEITIDQRIFDQMDDFFNNHKTLSNENLAELKKIIEKEGKNKLKISRNKNKARVLKKRIEKYFYILKS